MRKHDIRRFRFSLSSLSTEPVGFGSLSDPADRPMECALIPSAITEKGL
jgi:hypothetical protein